MKLAVVFDGLRIGGIEKVGSDYCKIFEEMGYDVDVYNLNPKYNEMKTSFSNTCNIYNCLFPRWFSPEIFRKFIKIKWWGRFLYPFVYVLMNTFLFLYKIIYRLLNHKKYDIVIAFSSHFNDLCFVQKRFLRSKKNVAWVHGAIYSYNLISEGFIEYYKKIKNLVVLVEDCQKEFLTYNNYLDLNISKIYNPSNELNKKIDFSEVKELKKRMGKFILMVSRFEYPHKDHYTVIKAFNEIVKRGYDINLCFVGDGPEKQKVQKFVYNYGQNISKKVFFEGSKFNVQDYYEAAYLLVHASVAGEGLPTILIESLAHKLPIVATDSKTGPSEILGNNLFGMLCEVENYNDMADCFAKMIDDQKMYYHFKSLSLERYGDFTFQNAKEKVEDFFGSLK